MLWIIVGAKMIGLPVMICYFKVELKTFFPWRKHAVGSDAPCETAILIPPPLSPSLPSPGTYASVFLTHYYSVYTALLHWHSHWRLYIIFEFWEILLNTLFLNHDFQECFKNRPVHLIAFMTFIKPSSCWIYKFLTCAYNWHWFL